MARRREFLGTVRRYLGSVHRWCLTHSPVILPQCVGHGRNEQLAFGNCAWPHTIRSVRYLCFTFGSSILPIWATAFRTSLSLRTRHSAISASMARGAFPWHEIKWDTAQSIAKANRLVRILSPLFGPPQQLVPCPILQE